MNFREELNRLRENKSKSFREKALSSILKKLLVFFEECNDPKISEEAKLTFSSSGNLVYVRETDKDPLLYNSVLLKEFLGSPEEAHLLLIDLEQQLKDEKFEILPGKSAKYDKSFSAIIKP